MKTMKEKILIIRRKYEPNRLAENYLLNAYEKIVPIKKHLVNSSKEKYLLPTKGDPK